MWCQGWDPGVYGDIRVRDDVLQEDRTVRAIRRALGIDWIGVIRNEGISQISDRVNIYRDSLLGQTEIGGFHKAVMEKEGWNRGRYDRLSSFGNLMVIREDGGLYLHSLNSGSEILQVVFLWPLFKWDFLIFLDPFLEICGKRAKLDQLRDLFPIFFYDWDLGILWAVKIRFQEELVYIEGIGKKRLTSLLIISNSLQFLTIGFVSSFFGDCKMSQGQWIAKSGERKGEATRPGLRISIPRFDNSEIIARYARTLIGRCMNP